MAFKLAPAPEFDYPVRISRADGADDELPIRWRHKDRDALKTWIDQLGKRPDAESLAEVIVGWTADGAYSPAALEALLRDYAPAGQELTRGYLRALTESRQKN